MFKIAFILIALLVFSVGIFIYFNKSMVVLENPIVENFGKILGSAGKNSKNAGEAFSGAKDSFGKNVEDTKETAYNNAKTTLDSVFNKQSSNSQQVSVNVLGVENDSSIQNTYNIDLSKDSDLKLNLAVNIKYYLKFQNIPSDYCLYISGNKYPITEGILEIQFKRAGSFPIKANNCNLNDKNIGNLEVQ